VLDKFDEELAEMREAMASGDRDAMEDELGDILFVATNLARQLDIDPGTALRRGNAKFEKRFRAMEDAVGGHDGLTDMGLNEMEALWQKVKKTIQQDERKKS
jgi:ATP diphosphatase